MAIRKEIIEELMANYQKPEDLLGEGGLMIQLKKALIERAMNGEMTHHWVTKRTTCDLKAFKTAVMGRQKRKSKHATEKSTLKRPVIARQPSNRKSSRSTRGGSMGLMIKSSQCTRAE